MKIQKSKLITESIWVSIAEYMMLASIFLVNIVLNRKYGTEVLGKFSVAYSISQIIIFGLGTGFSPLIRRELTLNQDNKEELVNNVLHLRMLLLLFVCFLSIVLGSFFFKDRSLYLIFIIFLFSRGFDLISDTFYVFYQSVDRIETYSYLKISHSIFLIISIFILAYLGFSEKYIYLVFLFVSAIFLIINVLLIRLRKELNLTLKGLLILTKNKIILLNDVLPLILNSIIFQLKSRSSVLIVFVFLGTIATGTYSSVLMTITIFTAASSPLGIVLFPKLNKAFSKSSKDVIIQMQKIILTLDAYKKQAFEAKITKIYPAKDERNQTFKIEGKFTTTPKKLYPGLTGEANIIIAKRDNVLTIPNEYISAEGMVNTDDGPTAITIGLQSMKETEILSGIDSSTVIYKPE